MTSPPLRLHIGAGDRQLPGFTSVDLLPGADVQTDVTLGLPFDDGSVDAIYIEHFIEHQSQAQGVAFLRECRRVLRRGGVLRVATPDLEAVVDTYRAAGPDSHASVSQWIHTDSLRSGIDYIDNRCEMLNVAMRNRAHQWLYDEEELRRLAEMAGLAGSARCGPGESAHPFLRGLEHRHASGLILEFERPQAAPDRARVSLLVAAYTPHYLAACLRSAVSQTHDDLEIVVCDDRGDGGGRLEEIVAAVDDDRIVYRRNPQNLGNLGNYLECFRHATGEYVKFLNDDDLLYPTCVASQVRALATYPDVTLTTSHRQVIDATGQPLPDSVHSRRPLARTSVVDGVYAGWLITNVAVNFIGEPTTVLFRRRDVAHLRPHLFTFGGRNPGAVGDVTLWLSLLSRGDLYYDVETLSAFRQHEAQLSRPRDDVVRRHQEAWQKLRQDAERLGFYQKRRRRGPLVRPVAAALPGDDPLARVRELIARQAWDEAISGLEACVEARGHNPETALLLGDIMRWRTSVDKARQVWQEGLQSGERPLDLELLARLHLETGPDGDRTGAA